MNGVSRLLHLLTLMVTCLTESIDAFDAARPDFANLCSDLPKAAGHHKMLPDLDKQFRKLDLLRRKIQSLADRGETLYRISQARLTLSTLAVSQEQQRVANDSKNFAWIMMQFFSPIALSTSVFSMQQNFLPLVKPNFGWFVALIIIFGLLSLAVQRVHALPADWFLPVILKSVRRCLCLPNIRNSRPKWLLRGHSHDLESGVGAQGITT
jgi:hypothetical protein